MSLLHEFINNLIGDEKAEELCVHLMQSACVPYMKMLSMWIYKGIISDPIKEVVYLSLHCKKLLLRLDFSFSLRTMKLYKKRICLLIIPPTIG